MNKESNHTILLDRKGMSFPITSIVKGMIWLLVKHDCVELDLMLFYKTIDGKEGGVFSDHYRGNMNDLGTIVEFPYICHIGDIRPTAQLHEEIRFRKIDNSISEIFILVVDYNSALDNIPVDFTTYDSQLKIQYHAENFIEIPVNCSTKGNIYVICRILNKNGEINIINESNCISLQEAYNLIPGFNLICS